MQRRRLLVSALLSLPAACAHGAAAETTRFAVLGDAPYGAGEEPEFGRVIDRINADPTLRFAVHVGDIKAAAEPCSDALIRRRLAALERLTVPWLYTPGDNEWTDCHHRAAGRFNPLERLRFLRRAWFADPAHAHGAHGFAVHSQGTVPGFSAFVENQRFELDGIVFATLHMVGSDNGLASWRGIDSSDRAVAPRKDRVDEVRERTAAALAWIDTTFAQAQAIGARAVVLFFHTNPEFERAPGAARRKPFNTFLARIHARAATFGKPVLLAHGDHHWYTIDRPFAELPAVVRLQVPGSPFVGWVNVTVRAAGGDFFQFERGSTSTREAP